MLYCISSYHVDWPNWAFNVSLVHVSIWRWCIISLRLLDTLLKQTAIDDCTLGTELYYYILISIWYIEVMSQFEVHKSCQYISIYIGNTDRVSNYQKHWSITVNLWELGFGTRQYQSFLCDTSTQYDSPYWSLIRYHKMIPWREMMLEHLPDRKIVASIAGDTISTDLNEAVNRSVKELEMHDSWHDFMNIKVFERISKSIQCVSLVAD
jgi:hypothetical protein